MSATDPQAPPQPPPPGAATHLVIRASAGTGKTYRLTHRLVALLAQGVPPERILASTFTRKAAGEILVRVIGVLAEACVDERKLAATALQLAREPGAPGFDAARARAVLVDLLRSIQRLEVRTLDGFFHQLARVAAWELDLPPGWTLAQNEEAQALAAAAVAAVVAQAGREELHELLVALHGGAPKRAVHSELESLLVNSHTLYREATEAAWLPMALPDPLGTAELAELAAAFAEHEPPLTKAGKPRVHWVNALAKLADGLVDLQGPAAAAPAAVWEDLVAGGPFAKWIEGEAVFSSEPLSPEFCALLARLRDGAAAVLLAPQMQRLDAWRRLLQRYDAAFTACQQEQRLFRFEDVPVALRAAGVTGGDAAQDTLAFRLDGRIEHVLLDEFQDTSTVQWQVLAPLVQRALSEPARHLFCVGDTKQSIYGWRSGEPRLLDVLAVGGDVSSEGIDRSYRSAPAIIEAVNRVFTELPRGPAGEASDVAARRAAARFSESFPLHETARGDLAGAVRLWEVPVQSDDDSATRARAVFAATADLAAQLAHSDAQLSIAILVRRNAPIPRLIEALRQRGVLASGEGGNPVTDSEAVTVLLSLLLLADHPGDSAAAFHVATSPLGALRGLRFEDLDGRRRVAAEVRAELRDGGFAAVCAAWRAQVAQAPAWTDWDRRRVAQLQDLALDFDARGGGRPEDFVEHVRAVAVENPASARVRVLTVHAAKGLEFDAVLCPELEGNPLGSSRNAGLRWLRSDPQGPVDAVFPNVKRDLARLHPPLAEQLAAARERDLTENLCVLYVALTRARRRLDLLLSSHKAPDASWGAALRHALVESAPSESTELSGVALLGGIVDAGPRSGWLQAQPAGGAPPATEATPRAPREDASAAPDDSPDDAASAARPLWRTSGAGASAAGLRRRAPSSREGGGRRSVEELLGGRSPLPRLRGSVLHEWCRLVTWVDPARPDGGLPDDTALLLSARRTLLRLGAGLAAAELQPLLADWSAEWRAALLAPALRAVLTQSSAAAQIAAQFALAGELLPELWRERPFLVLDEEPAAAPGGTPQRLLVPGAFDRVVLWRQGGELVAATLLDFKSDRLAVPAGDGTRRADAERLAHRVAFYAPQMEGYRRALQRLVPLPAERIATALLFLDIDCVQPL